MNGSEFSCFILGMLVGVMLCGTAIIGVDYVIGVRDKRRARKQKVLRSEKEE